MNDARIPSAVAAAALPAAGAAEPAVPAVDGFGDPSLRLAAAFDTIARTRMAGVPILNDALRVQCVGFRRWDGFWLGVLVTPWCMNLMLLPADAARWPRRRIGEKVKYVFPAGVFEFIAGREALLASGRAQEFGDACLMCSLFSPVFEFADHDAAVATAAACLDALFDEANFEATEMAVARVPVTISADAAAAAERAERQAIAAAGGTADVPPEPGAAAESVDADADPTPAGPAAAAVSKRDFLRGRWSTR